MHVIDIKVKQNRIVSPNRVFLGNQYEEGITYLNIILDDIFKDNHVYLFFKNKRYNKFLIYPLIDKFNITQKISEFDGTWYIYILVSNNKIDNIESLNNEENLFGNNDFLFVSNVICGDIKNVRFNLSEQEEAVDPNLKILYDDLLNLKEELEDMISKSVNKPPIGSVILLTVDVNPSEYFNNTTWERFAPGLNLRGVDIDSDFYNVVEKISGGESITLETVTSNEAIAVENDDTNVEYLINNKIENTYDTYSPNITVYMWKRIS